MLDLSDLRLLAAIAECGSMARAGRQLGIVPSAVTYRVRTLEERLDLLLVDRRGARASLTASALQLLAPMPQLDAILADSVQRARRMAAGFEAELVIAVDAVIPTAMLWPIVRAFDTSKAPTQLRFWQEVMGGSWEALLSGRADLVLGAPGEIPAHPEIRVEAIGSVEFVFCLAPDHPLARLSEPLTPQQIAKHRAIAVGDSARSMPRRTAGLLPGQPVLTVPDFRYKVEAQVAGLGVGYLPRHWAKSALEDGRLTMRRTAQGRISAPLHLAWNASVRGRALAWFLDALRTLDWTI